MPIAHCKKCGFDALYEHREPEACPQCGAIYKKVADAGAYPLGVPLLKPVHVEGAHIDKLRAESLYPNFRSFVNFGHWIGIIVGGFLILGAAIGLFTARSLPACLGGLFSGLLVILLARFSREAWLMLADLSDAAVRIAEQTERR